MISPKTVSKMFLAAMLSAVAVSAHADDAGLASWVKAVNIKVNAALVAPPALERTGLVSLSFRRAADGTARDVQCCGAVTPAIARAATATIRKLHDLPPLPAGVSEDTRITMRLVYGSPTDSLGFHTAQTALWRQADVANTQFAARMDNTQLASRIDPR